MSATADILSKIAAVQAGGYTSPGVTRNAAGQGSGTEVKTEVPERSESAATSAVGKGLTRQSAGKPVPGNGGVSKTAAVLQKVLAQRKTAEVSGAKLLRRRKNTGRSMLGHALRSIVSK